MCQKQICQIQMTHMYTQIPCGTSNASGEYVSRSAWISFFKP